MINVEWLILKTKDILLFVIHCSFDKNQKTLLNKFKTTKKYNGKTI